MEVKKTVEEHRKEAFIDLIDLIEELRKYKQMWEEVFSFGFSSIDEINRLSLLKRKYFPLKEEHPMPLDGLKEFYDQLNETARKILL